MRAHDRKAKDVMHGASRERPGVKKSLDEERPTRPKQAQEIRIPPNHPQKARIARAIAARKRQSS